jgi:catechol 2,3-dioxygenase-like lactoylglutathione lyase family enzyme
MIRLLEAHMRRLISVVVTVAVSVGALALRSSAQQGSVPVQNVPRNIVRISKYIISVSNADRSAAFYQGVFGIPFANGASQVPKAQPIPDLVQKLTSVAAPAAFRATLFAIPGAADDFVFEQTEFTGPARPSKQPRMQDPGASFLVLNVRDLDAAIAGVKRLGGTIVSTGGQPVANNGNRAVVATDPDGAFIEIIQPPQLPPAADSKSLVVSSPRVAFVVADAEKAGQFYRDRFGFDVRMPGPWNEDQRIAGLPGLPGSKVRSATVTVPGKTLAWQFYEYGGLERTTRVRNIPDPGAPAVGFEVRDAAAALQVIKAAGGTVISAGGVPVEGRNIAFARDPNGVLLEVIQVTAKP